MPKRKISKASKRRLSIFGPICFFFIIYFIFSFIYNSYRIYDLSLEKKNLENAYKTLQEKSEELKKDIEKLNDDAYLANYAREKYLYSKDGEYVLQLEDEISKDTEVVSFELNKRYIIILLSFVMVIIILYILIRGRQKTKSQKKKL